MKRDSRLDSDRLRCLGTEHLDCGRLGSDPDSDRRDNLVPGTGQRDSPVCLLLDTGHWDGKGSQAVLRQVWESGRGDIQVVLVLGLGTDQKGSQADRVRSPGTGQMGSLVDQGVDTDRNQGSLPEGSRVPKVFHPGAQVRQVEHLVAAA